MKHAPVVMDSRLLMASRNGDLKLLENLLVDHEVRQTASEMEPHFVIHMPEGAPTTDRTGEGVNHQPHDERDEEEAGRSAQQGSVFEPSVVSVLDGVTLDSEEDSALHVVASSGDTEQYLNCAELIYSNAKHLLDAANKSGDTPLHCAARAGNLNMVSRLIEVAKRENHGATKAVELIRRKNLLGETALHGAIRSANQKVIEKLMMENQELVHIPSDGTSPLYLAISLGRLDIAWELMQTCSKRLSYSGPDGRNVLHVAVFHGEALSILLKMCKDVEVGIQMRNKTQRVPLLSYLTNQRDKNGSTPLHYAASLETWSTGFSRLSEHFWPKPSPTALLLDANISSIYQPDNKGYYPIHVATSKGSLKVVTILLRRCPDCATLRDTNGRTFLHVAVEEKRHDIVAFISRTPEFESILNLQDKHGDTALHLAVQVGVISIFNCLFRNRKVLLDLPNMDGLTPRDLSWTVIPARIYNKKNPRSIIYQSLVLAGAAVGYSRQDHFRGKYTKTRDENTDSEYISNATQVLGISSVLVATVTFAAAFTLPGGYRADDHANGGTPTLSGRYAFDAFVISNTLAFICSLLSSISLVYCGVPSRDISTRRWYFGLSRFLLHTSIRSLIAAFAMGMYVVLAPVALKIATSVCVISFASLLCGTENMDVWRYIVQANTFRIRFGILAAMSQVKPILRLACKKYWSYVIVFGLPAVLKIHGTS
ncbi:hypothetical protein ACP70R_002969 [Stipagrostis hirtigluma subsp. patula]